MFFEVWFPSHSGIPCIGAGWWVTQGIALIVTQAQEPDVAHAGADVLRHTLDQILDLK